MRTNLARAGCLAAVAALFLASDVRAADLQSLLRRSAKVESVLSYQGRKVLSSYRGGRAYSNIYKVYHKAPHQTTMDCVEGELHGYRLVQVKRNHYLRAANTRSYLMSEMSPIPDNTTLLLQNYKVQQLRVEPIARRKCVMIGLQPRHRGNPSKILWIDVETALPLKIQMRSSDGTLTEQTEFLLIDYRPKFNSETFRVRGAINPENPEVAADFDVLRLPRQALPAGYRQVGGTVCRRTRAGHVVAYQWYSDGLNMLTLIQSLTHPDPGAIGGSPVIEGRVGRVRYAICGEHRKDVLQKMADFLRRGSLISGGRD